MPENAASDNAVSDNAASQPGRSNRKKRSRTHRRLVCLALVGLALIGGLFFFRYFWLTHPVGSGPAGPPVARESFESPWTDGKVLLVGLGDSVTDGLGSSPGSKSYFNRLVKNPADEFPEMQGICLSRVLPHLEAENLAQSGSTSIENLEVQIPQLGVQDEETYGVVVMTTGGNDIIHHYGRRPPAEGAMYGATLQQAEPWIENFRARLDITVAEIEARFPGGCSIFIGTVYDPTDGVGNAVTAGLPRWPDGLSILHAYNTIIEKCAEARETVHVVNIHDTFLGHGIYSLQFWNSHYRAEDPHYWYWDNFEDPNNRGYDAIRRLFLIEMAKVLPPILATPPPDRRQPSGVR